MRWRVGYLLITLSVVESWLPLKYTECGVELVTNQLYREQWRAGYLLIIIPSVVESWLPPKYAESGGELVTH